MIHPSYVDLLKVVNKNVEEGETPVINSRYSIVMATAKRARQIVDGDEPLVKVSRGEKPLSIAVDELNQEEIRILAEDEVEEEYTEFLEESAGEAQAEETAEAAGGTETAAEAAQETEAAVVTGEVSAEEDIVSGDAAEAADSSLDGDVCEEEASEEEVFEEAIEEDGSEE